ncbi:hypothetical protein ANTRET_LOCUS7857 [Anthophora retusa]
MSTGARITLTSFCRGSFYFCPRNEVFDKSRTKHRDYLLPLPLELDARVTKPSVTVRRSFACGRSYLFAEGGKRRRRKRKRERERKE